MEHISQFNKGINSDTSKIFQPKDTAIELKNWVQLSEDGDTYSLINEQGCTDVIADIPSGFKIIGHTILDRDIICILAHPNGYSQAGIIDYSGKYTRKVPSTNTGSQLGFTIDNPVDCVAKKTYGGDRIVYYTDNNIPFGSINLDTRLDDSELEANSKLIKDINAPFIIPTRFIEGGNLFCGVYQFSIRYINEDGSTTPIVSTCDVVPVTDEATNSSNKDGGDVTKTVSKSIVLELSNLDTNYEQYQIVLHRRNNAGTVVYSYAQPPIVITDSIDTYTFSGNDSDSEILDLSEVRETTISYNKAKCIEQIDNRLVLGNLTEGNTEYNEELQNIANNIVTKYKVKQEVISSNNLQQTYTTFNLLYGYELTSNSIKTRFSNNISSATSANQFSVTGTDSYSNSSITITDVSALISETLTIGSDVFTFTNTETGIPFDIYIDTSGSIIDAGNSIRTAINSDSGSEFDAIFDGIDVINITYKVPTSSTYTFTTSIPTSLTLSSVTAGSTPVGYDGSTVVISGTFATVSFSGLDFSTKNYWSFDISGINDSNGAYPTITSNNNFILPEAPSAEDIEQIIINNYAKGYRDEFNTTYRKGYKRGEVYSLALVVKFKDGSDSYAYHIPGNNMTSSTTTSAISVDGSSGTCGTYVSSVEYPLNQNLPGTDTGDSNNVKGQTVLNRNIRHHKMPELDVCTHVETFDSTNGVELSINILGLECEFTIPFSSGLASTIQSYSIVRESREREGNKSIICQGFATPMYEFYRDLNAASGVPDTASKALTKSPFYNKLHISSPGAVRNYLYNHEEDVKGDIIQFYSPELNFQRITPAKIEGKTIEAKIGMSGHYLTVPDKDGDAFERRMIRYYAYSQNGGERGYYDVQVEGSLWIANNFQDPTVLPIVGNTSTKCTIDVAKFVAKQTNDEIEGYGYPLDNSLGSEAYILKTTTSPGYGFPSLPINENITDTLEFLQVDRSYSEPYEEIVDSQDSYDLDNSHVRSILEVKDELANQYGSLDNTEYLEIHRSLNIQTVPFTEYEIFGGDTFINLFSVTNKNILQTYKRRIVRDTSNDLSYDDWIRSNIDEAPDREPTLRGFNAKSLYCMYLESSINCDYRHEFIDDSGTQQTRYYNKSDSYDTLKVAIEKGECISYNTQYSLENSIKTYYAKTLSSDISGDFKNRIIYSDNAGLDSIIDNYRQFPVNNYQDIPKHTGEIWDLFVLNDIIYAHTPKSLWRLYSKNNTSIQTSDISEVILGTGDAFNIDANQNYRFEGGYAGSISQFAGVHTPSGYIFPDILQGKVFIFNGQGLQELSRSGVLIELSKNLKTDLVTNTRYYDNPFTGYGITCGYDFKLKRYLLTKHDSIGGFTYSYSFIGNCWLSKHDYTPNIYLVNDDKLYFIDNDNSLVYLSNNGDMGDFKTLTNGIVESSIRFVVNPSITDTKVFDNIVINSNSYDQNDVYQPYDTFQTINIYNDLQSTGTKSILVNNEYIIPTSSEIQAKFKNNEYRLAIPRSNSEDRLKSKYVVIDLSYNNALNNKFLLNYIITKFRINQR